MLTIHTLLVFAAGMFGWPLAAMPMPLGAALPAGPAVCGSERSGNAATITITVLSDDQDGPAPGVVVQRVRLADDEDSPDQPAILHLRRLHDPAGGNIEDGGPWLGISYGPVPKPLAAHLKIDADGGQMVLNLVEGSPADQAGLERYDVIVRVDGDTAPADAGAFLEMVRELRPGEECRLTVIHEGRETERIVTIGSRPKDMSSLKQKYEAEVEELSQGRVLRRGGLLERDDKGNWLFKRFDLPDLPDVFRWLPDDEDFTFDLTVPGGPPHASRHVFILKTDEKTSLRLEQGDDGEIKVTRTETDADGNEKTTTKTYENEDALQKDDPEAFELIKNVPEERAGGLAEKYGLFRGPGKLKRPHGRGDATELDVQEIRKKAEEMMKEVEELRQKYQREGDVEGFIKRVEEWRKKHAIDDDSKYGLTGRLLERAGKPRTSFEMLPGGEVRVTQRRGDNELVETYQSADDLKEKNPELYRKFERLQGDGGKKALRR